MRQRIVFVMLLMGSDVKNQRIERIEYIYIREGNRREEAIK